MKFKKLFSLFLIVPFLFVFMATLVACKKKEEPQLTYDGMKINMTDWTSIGAAEIGKFDNISASNVSFGNASSVSSSNSKKFALVGADKNGNYKKIKFHKDGKEHEPELNLMRFNQTDYFMFLGYYKGSASQSKIDTSATTFYANAQNYIVDKLTGNIYKIDKEFSIVGNAYAFSQGKLTEELKKKILVNVPNNSGYASYQEVTIENNKLKFVEILNQEDVFGHSWMAILAADRFGNKIISHNATYYILTNNNQLRIDVPEVSNIYLDEECIKKDLFNNLYINAIDGYYKILEDGTFEKMTAEPKIYKYIKRDAIKIEGSTEYYLSFGDTSKIEKVEYTDTDFEVTEIPLEDFVDNYKVGQDYIFTLKDNIITKYSIIDGIKTIVNIDEDLIFKTWEIVGNDEIFFTAINNILQEVKCLVDEDGISHYTYTDIIFKIYYLMPINNNES